MRDQGVHRVLTIVARRAGSTVTSAPPADLDAYGRGVARQIRLNDPQLAVIENEEQAPRFYDGSPEQYLRQLEVAVRAAHSRGHEGDQRPGSSARR